MSTQYLLKMLKDNRTIKKYSESFKLKVLSEIESGKYTKTEVCKLYGIGYGSLYKWTIISFTKSHERLLLRPLADPKINILIML